MKNAKLFCALYLIGVIFTNSYVRMHRLAEWDNGGLLALKAYKENVNIDRVHVMHARNRALACMASILWPIYVTSCIADTIVCTKVDIKPPEILRAP